MLTYSVLFTDDKYFYIKLFPYGENIKICVPQYSEWSKDKMEI